MTRGRTREKRRNVYVPSSRDTRSLYNSIPYIAALYRTHVAASRDPAE